jgi:tetratricopeptide (TPR) repeat protein
MLLLVLACSTTPSPNPPALKTEATTDGEFVVHGTDLNVDALMTPAVEAFRQGNTAESERLARAVVSDLEQRLDSGFVPAIANSELAGLLIAMGDPAGAVICLERAATYPTTTDEERKAKLTHLSMQADLYRTVGQPEKAVAVARDGLAQRLALYPEPTHPGRAYGHRTLADALLFAGDLEGANTSATEALRLFTAEAHYEVNGTVVLLGLIQVAKKQPVTLPEGVPLDVDRLTDELQMRAGFGDTNLAPVAAAVAARFPTERTHGVSAGLAWTARDLVAASHSATWLATNGSGQARQEAAMLLARIHDEQGDAEAAIAVYEAACTPLQDDAKAHCLREFGVFLAEDDARVQRARSVLTEAIAAGQGEVKARSRAALGILEAHHGTPDAARPLLEQAISALPPTHPDAVFARSHLRTLGTGACGCNDSNAVVSETVQAYADLHYPGLVQHVAFDGEAFQLTVSRQPSSQEEKALEDIQLQVMKEAGFRNDQLYGR